MSSQAAKNSRADNGLDLGRSILRQQSGALLRLAHELDESFSRAVECLLACRGSVIVSGMGKAGLIGQKIAATLASTGTRSHFLHPAEAVHGDLGRIHADDCLLLLSHSGQTEEVIRLLPAVASLRTPIIAITGNRDSQLSHRADITLWIGNLREAGPLRLAPTTSTTVMLALGDALAMAISEQRGFTSVDFARFHPGGALGRQLSRVEEVMRPREQCRIASDEHTVRDTLVALGRPGRRTGAIVLTDAAGRLTGIFTDSDLARMLERQQDFMLDAPIREVMTRSPASVPEGTLLPAALELLSQRKISELPVINTRSEPLGIIDITDVVASLPNHPEWVESHGKRDDAAPRILPLPNRSRENSVDEA
ncbi:MAG: KpsF/GutQ family sugar-phosphate isomerase [Planctomycetales bacterium]|nr:KpsF/GutQ family sugar-phosphate isomerase [Planctomycetales bacterium]